MRTAVRALVVVALCLLLPLSACGGGEDQTAKEAAQTPTPGGQAIHIASLSELESFRYSITLDLHIPALQDALLSGLGNLLSEFNVNGASVAPDKLEMHISLGKDIPERAVIIIGDRGWTQFVSGWAESPGTASHVALLSPKDLTANIIDENAFAGDEATKETLNGVDTLHYTTTGTDPHRLTNLFGTGLRAEELSETKVDVWLTEDKGYPIRLAVTAAGKDAGGRDQSIALEMNVTDLNDPGIEINPPGS